VDLLQFCKIELGVPLYVVAHPNLLSILHSFLKSQKFLYVLNETHGIPLATIDERSCIHATLINWHKRDPVKPQNYSIVGHCPNALFTSNELDNTLQTDVVPTENQHHFMGHAAKSRFMSKYAPTFALELCPIA
jgi:hypothetical protein